VPDEDGAQRRRCFADPDRGCRDADKSVLSERAEVRLGHVQVMEFTIKSKISPAGLSG
jgi:hypothetical protein